LTDETPQLKDLCSMGVEQFEDVRKRARELLEPGK